MLDTANEELIETLQDYVPRIMDVYNVPGLGVAMARDGEIVWDQGFGWANVRERMPMTAQTLVRAGSMSKMYTVTAILQLVEQGVLDLYRPINSYLSDLRVINRLGERDITVYDLLTHRSGLAGNAANCTFVPLPSLLELLQAQYARDRADGFLGASPLWTARVGEKAQYSNLGMATLGYLVEVTNPEGLSHEAYVQRHILDPLGMSSSQFPAMSDPEHIRPDLLPRLSTGYAQFGDVLVPAPHLYLGDYPAGTLITTAGDHLRLLLAYRGGGVFNGVRILQPETVRMSLTPQVMEATPRGEQGFGLGWQLTDPGTPNGSFGHGGAYMFGWINGSFVLQDQDVAMVVTTNRWDMLYWGAEHASGPQAFLREFALHWYRHGERPRARDKSRAWKLSYWYGLNMAAQLKGLLEIPQPVTSQMIDAMVDGGFERHVSQSWDPDGFRSGLEDMLSQDMSQEGVRAFLHSDKVRVSLDEMELLSRESGGPGRFPLLTEG